MMTNFRVAQYGTKHGHAGGKLLSMLRHPDVTVVGVYEPDAQRRAQVAQQRPYAQVKWFEDKQEMLGDPTIVAIASEGLNSESLGQSEEIVQAGKHVWYDKPAGDNWPHFQQVIEQVKQKGIHWQMGYMFRYQHAFVQVNEWAKSGLLGDIFSVRAHMSTHLNESQRKVIGQDHKGGILFDLGGHMLDQICWLLGRPKRVTGFMHNHTGLVPEFMDNTLGVFEFERAMAFLDIAAQEPRPMARRYEVYGSKGSAIIIDRFDPAGGIRLCLEEASAGYPKGVTFVDVPEQDRQDMYDLEFEAFVKVLKGEQGADRPLEHDIVVQETLLRVTGGIQE
jgi:predicted dehydrogenase